MNSINHKDIEVFLPMPIFPIIEDVGWWQGEDGSAHQQPYRNAFPRRHCLQDYQALVRLAKKLGVRIGMGMVLGEWDRTNMLKDVPGATWMGKNWNNRLNQGAWLDETAEYLRDNRDFLEMGMHALCHEFWNKGKLERSEFHDKNGTMRPPEIVRSHLEAFSVILEQNGFLELPRLFFPPALNHSFRNDDESIQAILHDFGIRFVITRFSRARSFTAPKHEKITWECGVGILERGISPVPWHAYSCKSKWDFSGPILPLHWGNLLHPDPERNKEIIDSWAEMLLAGTASPQLMLAESFDTCWRQAAVFYFGKLSSTGESIILDLKRLPNEMPGGSDFFFITVKGASQNARRPLLVQGALVLSDKCEEDNIRTIQLLPDEGAEKIEVSLK